MAIRLYVNIDHVATVREARRTDEPDPVAAARLAEAAGADGITAHLREDRRHIRDADLEGLARSVQTVLNAELALAPDVLGTVCRLQPYQATLVPERREEITTEGGLDLSRGDPRLADAIARRGEPHRPYLHVQMPRFPLGEAELQALVRYLVDADRVPPRDEPPRGLLRTIDYRRWRHTYSVDEAPESTTPVPGGTEPGGD